MGKFFSLTLLMLLAFVNTFANVLAGSITGKVVDSRTGQPVEYATVAVYNQTNNSLVTGTITDGKGEFAIDGIKNGTYKLTASFIGYNPTEISNILVDGGVKQLGLIKLATSDAEIEEVEVTAKKKDISYQLDKKVVNLSTDINADNGSAADALEGVPSVDVDIDGNVSLRGSSNFTVLIDGKPTALDAADVLKQTPAAMIDNIEIITNPSAKYDPEGTTGIINLVTKKNVISGLNGVVNANIGSQGRYGGDFLLNRRTGKINYFVGGYFNRRANEFDSKSNRITKNVEGWDKYVNQTNDNTNKFGGYGLRLGFDYYFDDNNLMNFSVSGGMWGSEGDGNTYYDNWSQLVGTSLDYQEKANQETVESVSDDESSSKYINANFSYTHNFLGKGHKIVASGYISRSKREADNSFTQFVKETSVTTGHIIDDNKSTTRGRFNLDYTKPLSGEGKFEAGMQEDYNRAVTDYAFNNYDQEADVYTRDPEFSNDLTFLRSITSVYATYGQTWGKFGLQLGLRGEYTYRNMDTKNDISDSTYTINRFDIFPSIHISQGVGERNSIQAGYSRRIRRPWERALNPFPGYSDEYSRWEGNPSLKPQYTDVMELNYQMNFDKIFVALETFYRHTDGATENVSSLASDGTGKLISRFENLSTNNNFGIELTGTYDITKWMRLNASFEVRQYYIKGVYNDVFRKEDGNSWRTKETLSLSPGKSTKIQITMRYRGKNKTLISSNKGNVDLGLAIRQSLFKKRVSVSFSMRDMLNTGTFKSTTDTEEYWLYNERHRAAPFWNLGVSFKINNVKDKRPDGEEGNGGSSSDDNSSFGGEDMGGGGMDF
ncbi:MAG: TonB-dependent receptor family protein [Bacteroidales bacterium]|nr:TonB-dependent receptor family protein [Bacteroidales bacterium]